MDNLSNDEIKDNLSDIEGKFEHPIESTGWYVPENIILKKGRLIWNIFNPDTLPGKRAKMVWAKPSLLMDFAKLYEESENEILEFALNWGILGLCEHGKPAWHVGKHCLPLGDHVFYNDNNLETILGWRKYSLAAHEILEEAAKIKRDMYYRPNNFPSHEINNRQVLLAKRVQSWLDQAGVKIEYFWQADKQRIMLGTPNLFAALAVQLMSLVGGKGIALCSNCGAVYMPTRTPRRDQRNYCDKPECRRAAWRDAKKDQRSKSK